MSSQKLSIPARTGRDADVDQVLARLLRLASDDNGLAVDSSREEDAAGYHTVREIVQQPATWVETASLLAAQRQDLQSLVRGGDDAPRSLVLTGSGSSHFIGECSGPVLERALGLPVRPISGGELLLTQPQTQQPHLTVSSSRSGDSPESVAAIDNLLESDPAGRHLIVSCNSEGRVTHRFEANDKLRFLLLPQATCDNSLVMTSSFTNLLLAGLGLGSLDRLDQYQVQTAALALAGKQILNEHAAAIRDVAVRPYQRAVYLGDLERSGAAREGALKLLEMTAGRVAALHEGFLGLRHGPMSFLTEDTLIVGFLSDNPKHRGYEMDLLAELDRKRLATNRILVGHNLDPRLAQNAVTISIPASTEIGPGADCILSVVVAQLVGLFRSVHEGLNPDAPSPSGTISRVVGDFPIH